MTKITIRRAIADDHEWIVQVAARNMLEQEVQRPECYNEQDCGKLADIGLTSGVIFVALSGDERVGVIGGMYMPNIYNSQITNLVELFWYVLPEYRGSRAGLLLLDAFCEVGRTTAHDVYMSLLSHNDINPRVLEKRGFKLREFGFHMRGLATWR